MSTVAAPVSSDRMPQLDGLRGAAILFVVWHHYGLHLPGWIDIGPIAPSIFFLLSGYLITKSLLKRPIGPSQLVSYHARRFGRLLPALYVMLAVGWFAGLPEFRNHLIWHAGFLTNVRMVAINDWSGTASHLWSLGVQEQFYLVWPFLFLLPTRWLPAAFLTVFCSGAVFRGWCLANGASDFTRWFLLPASLDAFAAGALVAWAMKARAGQPLLSRRTMIPATLLAITCWMTARNLRGLEGTQNLALVLVDVLETITLTFLLLILLQNLSAPVVRVFAFKPLVKIGQISYGIYIWHLLVGLAFGPLLARIGVTTDAHNVLRCMLLTAASVGVAQLSWIALERPFLGWIRRITAENGLWTTTRARWAKWRGGVPEVPVG